MKNRISKILVFGATGRTGKIIVKKLLNEGYQITAFVRKIHRLTRIKDSNFYLIQGSIHDYADVLNAIQDHDVVISALGTSYVLPNSIISKGVSNIITAMKASGTNNLIFQSSLGVGDSKGQLGIIYNLILLPFLLRFIFKDKEQQEVIITNSDLDWTIVRPAHFIPFLLPKAYRAIVPPQRPRLLPIMSRYHTAHFIIKECLNPQYKRKKVSLSYF